MNTTTTIDWAAADQIAERLGARTRAPVASRDDLAVYEWAIRMARDCAALAASEANWPTAATYLELSVLVSPEPAALDAGGEEDGSR